MKKNNIHQAKFNKLKAPINKDALWQKISEDEDFRTAVPFWRNKKYWFLLLLSIVAIGFFFSIFYQDQAIQKSTQSVDIQEAYNTPATLDKSEVVSNFNSENITTGNSSSLNKDIQTDQLDLADELEKEATNSENKSNLQKEEKNAILENNERTDLYTRNTQAKSSSPLNAPSFTKESTRIRSESTHSIPEPTSNGLGDLSLGDRGLLAIELLSFQKLGLLESQRNLSPKNIDTNPLKKKIKKWAVNLWGGIGMDRNSFKNNSTNVNDTLENRIANTSSEKVINLNLGITRHFGSTFSLSLEAEWRKHFQQYEFQNELTTIVKNADVSNGFYSYQMDKTTYRLYHDYQFINLNLVAHKYLSFRRSKLGLGLGANVNVLFQKSGNLVLNNALLFDLNDDDSYLNKTKPGFLAFINWEYQINELCHLSLQSRYHFKNQLNKPSSSYKHDLSTLMFGIGLGVDF